MTLLPHLAARLFGTPLLIARPKLEVILAVLGPRLGLPALDAAARVSAPKEAEVAPAPPGIVVIPIHGTATQAQGEIATSGAHVTVPQGSMVSFETAPADQTEDLKPALTAGVSRWMEAFNGHNAKAVAELYTQDAVFLPPNEPAVFGRDAIAATHAQLFATGDYKIDIEPLETVIDGQLAYVAGRYRMWTDDGTLVDRGKYIEIWRPVNGEWLISRDIYNSSIPPAARDDHGD